MTVGPILSAFAVLALGVLATDAQGASGASTSNLIVNGDFAVGRCTSDFSAVNTVPGWTVTAGAPALTCYGAARIATPDVNAAGRAFVANGPYGDAALTQVIDLSAAAAEIDRGHVEYSLSGWLGGWGNDPGQTEVSATFLSVYNDAIPMPALLSGVDAAARSGQTALLARSTAGVVPIGSRAVQVRVRFTGTLAFSSAAYADQLSLVLTTAMSSPVLHRPHSLVPAFDHVFMIMMENTDYTQVIGDTLDAPFINSLAARGTLLAAHHGVYHPSDENYLAVAGGDVFVSGPIYFPDIHVKARQIGDSLDAVGKSWKAYEQGMGTPCNLTSSTDRNYAPDDAPFINFTDVADNAARCAAHLVDTTQLTTDLQSAATTPNFSWIAADDYFDGEIPGNGSPRSLQVQDRWLKRTLGPIFASPAWTTQRSLLILTWDELQSYDNNHIATLLLGSQGLVRSGVVSYAVSDHYSIGRTIEAALGVPTLTPNDTFARTLNEAFAAKPVGATLSTATPNVVKGQRLAFTYATPVATYATANSVAVYPPGATPGNDAPLATQTASVPTGSASFDTSGFAFGNYVAWYLYDDGKTPLARPLRFTVTP